MRDGGDSRWAFGGVEGRARKRHVAVNGGGGPKDAREVQGGVRNACNIFTAPVSSQRLDQILASFDKMDPKKSGRISTADIKSLYNARNHPLYPTGTH